VGKALCSSLDSYSFDIASDFYKHKKRIPQERFNNIGDVRKPNIVARLRNVYTSSTILTG
jgi:hypothetical protein